jgi:hypothetical protein
MFKGKREFNFMKKKKKGPGSSSTNSQSAEWVRLRKTLHMTVRIGSVAVHAVIIVAAIIVFIMSLCQIRWPNAGSSFPSDQTDHYAYNKLDTDCQSDALRKYHPLRYEVLSAPAQKRTILSAVHVVERQDSTGTGAVSTSTSGSPPATPPVAPPPGSDERFEYCGWDARNTWMRMVTVFISIGWSGVLIGRLRKRSPASNSAAIWQKPRRVLRVLIGITAALGGWWGIVMIVDGSDVNYSRQWCLEQSAENRDLFNCDYLPFVVMVLLDMCMLLLWGISVLIMFLRYKYFNKYMQLEEEDEMELT